MTLRNAGALVLVIAGLMIASFASMAQSAKLTLKQAHVVKELIKDQKIEEAPISQRLDAGDRLPPGTKTTAVPGPIAEKLPQLKALRLVLTSQQIILVDPKDDKIYETIDRHG
jgi:hypothetical protein